MRPIAFSRRQFLALTGAATLAGVAPDLLLADAAKPKADARSAFFDSGVIPNITIDVAKDEADSLRRDMRKYVKATITEEVKGTKTVLKDVAIHLKGAAGSTRGFDDKPGITIHADKLVDDLKYHGMSKFHLNNSVQDPSYLTDLLCGELFRASGVPASLISHALVTINGRKCGFYVLKEGFDKTFLKNSFGGHDGNLYDGGFLRDLDQPLDILSAKEENKDRRELKALFEAANVGDQAKRFAKLEQLLDLPRFLSYVAMEVFTWDWDGYPMHRNNYRVYHDPKPNKITFFPSGMDQMFSSPEGPLIPELEGTIAHGLMETKEGRHRYLVRMGEMLKNVVHPDLLLKRLDELEKRVRPVLTSADAGAGNDFPNQVNRLRDAIRIRSKNLADQLKNTKA